MAKLTPMMQQYLEIHEKAKDSILFFRLGDFYEMFFDDAILASKELQITLTGRDCGLDERAPMCGVPYHSAENYIVKLIEKGYKVAIAEQVEDPSSSKGIVKREIIRIISPGTVAEGKLLKDKKNNFLMSIYYNLVDFGLAYVDISTGEFFLTEIKGNDAKKVLIDELGKIAPSEIIVNPILFKEKRITNRIKNTFNIMTDVLPTKYFQFEKSKELLKSQFNVYSLTAIDLEEEECAIRAAGALLKYLNETQMRVLSHINQISKYSINDYMVLDLSTRRNLELTQTIRAKDKKGSLLWVLDQTDTAMGGRLLRRWIEQPLTNKSKITERLNSVCELKNDIDLRDSIKKVLNNVYDLERLGSKISFGTCNARDLLALKQSIGILPELRNFLKSNNSDLFKKIYNNFDDLSDIYKLIEVSINPEAPIGIKDGNIIKSGYNLHIDELRKISTSGKDLITKIEANEKNKTGIKFLKIKYNRVFGYYIEVTKSNLHLVPDYYIRKQTLSNAERYFTKELKELETKILGSEEKSVQLEYQAFIEIREKILNEIIRIQRVSKNIAIIDVINSFANVSDQYNYIKPEITNFDKVIIQEGRHPVVEKMLPINEFIPNSCDLDCDNNRMIIITGPNMAGKSTYIRQIAIITLMAQIGCFVPADKADIGIVDRIFTRVGASDDLASGQSTFMVEMSEVSNILKNATEKSLIILDEIGRGTSTFDGLSIAWAVIEFLLDKKIIGAKTLFATHYHELTELESLKHGVKNYCIEVKEKEDGIIFLRKIVTGSTDKSFGIEVAKLAGFPNTVIDRANEILQVLENNENQHQDKILNINSKKLKHNKNNQADTEKYSLLNYKDKEIIAEINNLPLEDMTPLEVMNFIYKLKERLK